MDLTELFSDNVNRLELKTLTDKRNLAAELDDFDMVKYYDKTIYAVKKRIEDSDKK
jgi:hypothetical protein